MYINVIFKNICIINCCLRLNVWKWKGFIIWFWNKKLIYMYLCFMVLCGCLCEKVVFFLDRGYLWSIYFVYGGVVIF